MNIKDYYSSMARLYMNQTVLFSLVFITIILPSFKQVDFLHVHLSALVVSICLFNFFLKYVYFSGKNREVATLISSKDLTMSKAQSYILLQSPSSFSYYDIYSADGIRRFSISIVKGRMKRRRNKLSKTAKAKLMFRIEQQGSANISFIHANSNDAVIFMQENKMPLSITQINAREKEILIGTKVYRLKRQYADYIVSTDEKVMMRIKKGIMPIKMQVLFQPNTPVLSFERHLTEDQKYLCLCLLVFL